MTLKALVHVLIFLRVATAATLFTLVIGLDLTWLLINRLIKFDAAWETLIMLPMVSLPLMYQNCKAALAGVDPAYLKAARTLGMGESQIFRRITVPLAAPGMPPGYHHSVLRSHCYCRSCAAAFKSLQR
ncbi:MAG: hypothetical protein A3J97_06965 [Spirochaetes bacterium RIFOXYC1_FULL_54_7]|nr:MAG: hypothetical protein A3J97_06965 [Spirochaetes bacterium RIFOXYC1_FULL_54_7]